MELMQISNLIMLIIAAVALLATIAGNIVAIAFFAGKLSASQKSLDAVVKDLKENFNERIRELKESMNEKIKESNKHTEDHIKRLEEKQDKHNGLYDKVIENTQSCKSAHHRLDELTQRVYIRGEE
jgi:ribosome recycling factor